MSRLERIKQLIRVKQLIREEFSLIASYDVLSKMLDEGHINWLIEQVESNDTVNNKLEERFNKIQKENAELSILLRDTQIEVLDLQQQNKRYREALENIRNVKYDDDFNPYAYMKLEIFEWAEDALEGEE